MECDRCNLLFNWLERVIRLDNAGLVKIDTRLCQTCLFETGLFAVSPKVEAPEGLEEVIQEVEPPSYLFPGL
jgi:hypothetical protein